MDSLMTLLVLAIIGGTIYAYVKLKSGEVLRFETTSTPRQVTMAATGILAAKRKWETLSQGDGSAQFTYAKKPNWALVIICAITIIGFPIAVLYALLAGKKEALSVNTEEGSGMTVVQIASNGGRGKSAGRELRDRVGMAPASVASVASTQTQGELDPAAARELERASEPHPDVAQAPEAAATPPRREPGS